VNGFRQTRFFIILLEHQAALAAVGSSMICNLDALQSN
jgi:hypothetical protein